MMDISLLRGESQRSERAR